MYKRQGSGIRMQGSGTGKSPAADPRQPFPVPRQLTPGSRQMIAETPDDWRNLIGTAYALAGQDRSVGLNCYGLVREVYKAISIELPVRSEIALSAELAQKEGANWEKISHPEPYAVALMRTSEGLHLGIVTPDMQLLRCDTSKGVVVSQLRKYNHAILAWYRYKSGGGHNLPDAGSGDMGRTIGGALVAIAAIAAAVIATPFVGPVFASMIAMAISTVGSMIIDALFPLPREETPALSGWDNSLKDSRHYTWDGIVNDARPGLSKPMLFGVMKVGGQIISEKTRYDAESNEYLDMLICPVRDRITRFDDVRINDTEYIYYDQTQVALRPGDDEQGIIDIFNKIYTQYRSGARIRYDASDDTPTEYMAFTSKKDITGCRFVLSAPRGLYEIVGNTPTARDVVCRLQYKKHTDSEWSFVPGDAVGWGDEIPFLDRTTGVFTGTSNTYTLTDAGSGGGSDANFSDRIAEDSNFELVNSGTTYYCTQNGTLDATTIQFDAYTDPGRSVAKTGAFTDGLYRICDSDITYSKSGFTGRIWTGFNTDIDVSAIKFRLISYYTVDGSTTVTYSRYRVWYRKSGATSWTLNGTYEIGACYYGYYASGSWDIEISGLDFDKYEIRIDWASDCCTNPSGVHNVNVFAVDEIHLSAQQEYHTINGSTDNPLDAVAKTIELINLEEDTYNFRIWRTTEDQTSVYWSDDVYLGTYSEIIDEELAYPGHALVGVSAMATDRLSGGRPTITSIAIGPPLSVPVEEDRFDTEVETDEGIVTGSGNLVNSVIVDGMRKIIVPCALPAPSNPSIFYYWLVFMDSDGFAQPDRLLTKFYQRVHTWEEVEGGKTRLYLQSTEAIPAETEVMVFYENYAPTDSVAWSIAKMLIEGSHGRITPDKLLWDTFAELEEYNLETVEGEQRHKFDALIDFSEDLWGLALRFAGQADAMIVPAGNKFKVVIDRPVSVPEQVFGEGNTKNVHIHPIPKRDRANILVVTYKDENANYEDRTVSEEDVAEGEYPVVKTLSPLVGVTRESEVRRYLRRLLGYNRYVDHEIEFEAGNESIEVESGGVFAFQSQANDFAASGRIPGTNEAGDMLILDKTVAIDDGETYRLRVWGTDGTVYTWEGALTGDAITEITKPSELTIDNEKPYECNYILAKTSEVNTMYRTKWIKRSPGTMFSTIRGIVYRDEVYE